MSFANFFFLFALPGAAAPLLIHLLTRDRIQHVPFSTLRFFVKGAKLVLRRKKFQELLLLLLRTALLALLVLAFARPFFGSRVVDGRHEFSTARVIVLDVSGSMRRPGLADELRKNAVNAVASLHQGDDAAAVITFADTANVDVPLGGDIAAVKAAAGAVTAGFGGTNIAEALSKANELLRSVRAKQKSIVLISDLQRHGWSYFQGDWKLASDVKLDVDAISPSDTGDGLAITEISAPNSLVLDGQPSSIALRIANYSHQPRDKVDATFLVDGKKVDAQQVNLRANSPLAVRFRHVFNTPGYNLGSVTVGSSAVYFATRTLAQIPVLVVDGHLSADPQTDAAFFIDKALAPTTSSPFTVTTLPTDKVTAQDVAASTVVVLANVGEVPAPVVDALASLLEHGGGILFLPGDQVKAETFNATFGKFAPCKLRQVLQARPANGETAESLARIDFNHPILNTFSFPHHGDLTLPKFARYWETTDTQLSRVLARFGDNRPAILEREVGKGISMALVSAIDPNWNDFARQSIFLPWMHQTARYLAIQTGQKTNFTSGELLPIPPGDTLKDPQGQAHAAADAGTKSTGYYASQPGFYQLLNNSGTVVSTYAVNASLTEADPATISSDEMIAAIQRAPDEAVGNLEEDTTSKTAVVKKDTGLWWYLVWGILGLSFVELVVGNRTVRH